MSEAVLERLTATLTLAGERAGDIVPAVFEQFFRRNEQAQALMRHSDQPMQGRMFEGTVELLLSREALEPEGYLDWELDNHLLAYGATASMYADYLAALESVVRGACAEAWSAADADAWHARVSAIMARVQAFDARR